MKILHNRTDFVISKLFQNEECELHFIFMKGIPASKEVGNLWFRAVFFNLFCITDHFMQ